MNNKITPILIFSLIVAAFLLGSLWTKVKYLESQSVAGEKLKIEKEKAEEEKAGGQPVAEQPSAGEVAGAQKITVKIEENDPVKGPADAKVTIVEFSDFQCPYCGKVQPTLKQIFEEYSGKVRLVLKHYPLQFHQFARTAAIASMCASEQGKFWEYHDKLFANQNALTTEDLKRYGAGLGMDIEQFNGCLKDERYAKEVDGDMAYGTSIGVSGTPAFFINGQFLNGAQPFENFKKVIDEELKKL